MVKSIHLVLFLILFGLISQSASSEDTLNFGRFSESGLDGWEEKSFKGNTEYLLVQDGQVQVMRAKSDAAASGLVYETAYNPAEYPILNWRWKVKNVITKGDGHTRAGDDYAARIYVVFPHWFFPKTRTLNYIWANQLGKEVVVPNAYTGNAMMIAVESGAENVGQWLTVRRNVIEDYRKAFGGDPPKVGAIAIMTDTDNTGESAIAWYGDIYASRE